jgi:hypothetical protein
MEAAKNGSTNAAMSSAGERKPMGLFDFLAPIASIGAQIPGPWQPYAMGASALMGAFGANSAKNKAAGAAGAAQGAQAGAMAGEAGIANQLSSAPDYGGTLQAENQGINTLKANMGGIANPGALIKDLQGGNIEKAIAGDNANKTQRQEGAAGILNNLSGGYNQIGTQAGAAANAQGNPFGGLMQSIPGMIGGGGGGGGGLGSLLGGGAGAGISSLGAGITPGQPSSIAPFSGGGSGTLAPSMPANPFA